MFKILKGKLSTYRKQAWNAFAAYIKKRDKFICITCGKKATGWQMNAGHWLPGRWNSLLFEETCVHAQCQECNQILGGNSPAYYEFMLKRYGKEEMIRLIKLWRKEKIYSKQDYKNIEEKYKVKLKELIN